MESSTVILFTYILLDAPGALILQKGGIFRAERVVNFKPATAKTLVINRIKIGFWSFECIIILLILIPHFLPGNK